VDEFDLEDIDDLDDLVESSELARGLGLRERDMHDEDGGNRILPYWQLD
jgi:hypothetical protein